MPHIIFRCDATADTGYGHLMRCVNLARHFRMKKSELVLFAGFFDDFATNLLLENDFVCLSISGGSDLSFLNEYNDAQSLFIIDSYEVDAAYINEVAKYRCKKIYFDDGSAKHDYENKADGIISIRIERPLSDFSPGIKLYSGLANFIAAPEMLSLREKNLSKIDFIDKQGIPKLLIFISGKAEGRTIERKLLKSLDSLGIKLPVFVIGDSGLYRDISFEQIELTRLAPSHYIYEYLSSVDFVISGGGLLKYETAFCGIPGAIYSITDLQQSDTDSFCRYELAYDLKSTNLDLAHSLEKFLCDKTIKSRIIKQSKLLFNTNSTQKLVNDLRSL